MSHSPTLANASRNAQCDDLPGSIPACLLSTSFLDALRRRLVRYGPDAEDVLGETLLRLCKLDTALRFHSGRGTPLRFSLGVARRVSLEFCRSRSVAVRGEITDRVPANENEPLEHLLKQERQTIIEKALSQLTEQDRKLVERYFEEFEEEDHQRRKGPMSSSERSRLCRARKHLRRMLRSLVEDIG